jgi:hypothetical protein
VAIKDFFSVVVPPQDANEMATKVEESNNIFFMDEALPEKEFI